MKRAGSLSCLSSSAIRWHTKGEKLCNHPLRKTSGKYLFWKRFRTEENHEGESQSVSHQSENLSGTLGTALCLRLCACNFVCVRGLTGKTQFPHHHRVNPLLSPYLSDGASLGSVNRWGNISPRKDAFRALWSLLVWGGGNEKPSSNPPKASMCLVKTFCFVFSCESLKLFSIESSVWSFDCGVLL